MYNKTFNNSVKALVFTAITIPLIFTSVANTKVSAIITPINILTSTFPSLPPIVPTVITTGTSIGNFTLTSGSVDIVTNNAFGIATGGPTFIDLNGNEPGSISSANITYKIGDRLELTYKVLSNTFCPAGLADTAGNKAEVVIDGQTFPIASTGPTTYSIVAKTAGSKVIFTGKNTGPCGIMIADVELVNNGRTLGTVDKSTTIVGVIGSPFPTIPLTGNTVPDNIAASFVQTGSTPVTGKIIGGNFVPDASQLIPADAIANNLQDGILSLFDESADPISFRTNFDIPTVFGENTCKTLIARTDFKSGYLGSPNTNTGYSSTISPDFNGTNIDIVKAGDFNLYGNQTSNVVDLNALSGGSLESNTLTTNIGDSVTLSFDYGSNILFNADGATKTSATVTLGSINETLNANPGGSLTSFTRTFAASEVSNVLQFASTNLGAGGIVVTNVKVTANCPQPIVPSTGGGTISIGNGGQTNTSTTVTTVNNPGTNSSINKDATSAKGVLSFEVAKPTYSSTNSTVDPSKTKILVTTETKKVLDSAKGGTTRTGGI